MTQAGAIHEASGIDDDQAGSKNVFGIPYAVLLHSPVEIFPSIL